MSRALMFIGGLLLIIVAAALLYLSFADLSPYRPQVEALVSSALGRDFRIMGELKLKALPNPSVIAEGVTLANAEWGAPTPMVAIGRVSAEVGLWSLVSGPIRIKWLELRDVAVLLEQNAAGKANWAFGADTQPKAAAESGGTRLPVVIELASLENVDVSLRRPGRDDFPVHAAIALRTDERGVLVASGSGSAGELPFTVDGTIAVEGQAGARVGIDASVAETTLRANALLSPKQVKFDGSVSPLSKLGQLFAIEGLPAADLGLAGTLILGADRYELRDGSAKLLDVESRINARVPRSGDAPIELEISINAPNLKEIRAELPMLALSSAATARLSADEISLDPFEIKVGESDYSGSLRAALRDPMSVVLKGKSKLLDFTPVQQPAAPADASASEASGPHAGAPAAPAKDAPASKWVLGEEPLPFDRLAALSVDAERRRGRGAEPGRPDSQCRTRFEERARNAATQDEFRRGAGWRGRRQRAACHARKQRGAQRRFRRARSALERRFRRRRRSKPDPAHRLVGEPTLQGRLTPSARIGGERPRRADARCRANRERRGRPCVRRHPLATLHRPESACEGRAILELGMHGRGAQAHRWRGQARADARAREEIADRRRAERSTSTPKSSTSNSTRSRARELG